MLKLKFLVKLLIIAVLFIPVFSCKKPPGPGGKATIKGRVYAADWDNQVRYVISRGYSVDTRVYIIYGKGNTISDDVRTGPDGSFEFKYLNKGHYKVYVNSIDTTLRYKGNDTYIPVIKEFDITGTSQTKNLEDFYINK
jgi:hypothetical protein